MKCVHWLAAAVALAFLSSIARAQFPPGEGPALGLVRLEQSDITGGSLSLHDIRKAGLKMFSTPFNRLDGYGDGPMSPSDPVTPGHRPTLQGNGTFLRVNGLDAQTCMECHSVGSNTTAPFTFAIGGVGGSNNNAMFQPRDIDVDDEGGHGFAFYDGRFINPPFLFGSGGVELLGKEMTAELQVLKRQAHAQPGTPIALVAKGVSFGTITYDQGSGTYDTTAVQGVNADLVVRPFGRKGEFPSVRAFDVGAMRFHFGMETVEDVGLDVDHDDDGVVNEILVGELSALHVFNTNLERPEQRGTTPDTDAGFQTFQTIGCAQCHVPALRTRKKVLTYSFPELPAQPDANVFYQVNLSTSPAGFDPDPLGGLTVPLFSDLKRHDMGPGLAENFGTPLDSFFITARLWGVADTAPFLHDGRALTLTDAILAHGGEAQAQRDAFDALTPAEKIQLLGFLRTLRTPEHPASDL